MTTRANDKPSPFGLLNLNKPIGLTSRDVVDLIARPLRKVKVGHAGTLDPLASGVLVVCVGAATRLIEYVQRMPKTYRARVRLGATSDTDDADGTIIEAIDPPVPTEAELRAALAMQLGTIDQVPPEFSAIKVAGERAYDLARAGREVTLKARPVTITRVELLGYSWPHVELEIDCGSGTYIRSIARDVGQLLGCGGLIEVLTRTRIGPFIIEDAIDPTPLDRGAIVGLLRPMTEAVAGMPTVVLDEGRIRAIGQWKSVDVEPAATTGEVAILDESGELVAIAESVDGGRRLAPRRVLIAVY
ncbi:MAG TPA: tRNA pseudouridine(55) synthase TruB [Isosphaeraceae bacterium]